MNSLNVLTRTSTWRVAALLAALALPLANPAAAAPASGVILGSPPERTVRFNKAQFPELALRAQHAEEAERAFNEPIRDAEGRIRYIVDFTATATDLYSDTPQPFDDLASWEKPAMRNFARALGAQHGFRPLIVTSWVGNSLVAHLTENQVAALRSDPRVTRITPDRRIRYSASLWQDTTGPNWQRISWGTHAVGGDWGYVAPNDNVRVYIIDSGVGYHVDLPNVIERHSAYVPPSPEPPIHPVGCYSHATHVAGIVGATGTGVDAAWGVDRGVKMVSINVNTKDREGLPCSENEDFSTTSGAVAAALSLAKLRITQTGKLGIVNLSSNSPAYQSHTTIGVKIAELTTPKPPYPGALVVMAAGNRMQSACEETYEVINDADGVIVVGGMDANGQQVVNLNGVHGFHPPPPGDPDNGKGSSDGPCVAMHAPSKNIYSTWGGFPQRGDITYSYRTLLSGTSMAAPHIAALAAYTAASSGGSWTPGSLEAQLRSFGGPLQSFDRQGDPIRLVKHPSAGSTIPAALPTAEFLIRMDGTDYVNPPWTLNLVTYTDVPVTLRYDSRGATNCTITAWFNGAHWYTVPNYLPAWSWGDLVYITPAGTYTWQVDCVSPHGTYNAASATITGVTPPPAPTLAWYVNNVDRTGQTVLLPAYQHFNFRWEAVNANSNGCNLSVWASWAPGGFWYAAENLPAAWDWDGPISLDPGNYLYDMTCYGPRGNVRRSVALGIY